MDKEIESIAISNGDSLNPIQVSVIESIDELFINGIVVLNPDGTNI